MTTDRKIFDFLPRRDIMAEIEYPGIAKLVSRLVWEREAQVRAVALGKPGKTWESWADSTFPLAGNWSKIGVDHMFDHNWKISYPGVAQLVARLLWEQDALLSSRKIPYPQSLDTPAIQALPPQAEVVKKTV